jgi:hypothetical protein
MSLAAIEAELKPKVPETFDTIADTFKRLRRLQDQDIHNKLRNLQKLDRNGVNQLPVTRDHHVVGAVPQARGWDIDWKPERSQRHDLLEDKAAGASRQSDLPSNVAGNP